MNGTTPTILLALLLAGTSGCVNPELSDKGGFSCTDPTDWCPEGYTCNGKACVPMGSASDLGKPDQATDQKLTDQKLADQKLTDQKLADQKLDDQKPPDQKPPDQKPPDLGPPDQNVPDQKLPPDLGPPDQWTIDTMPPKVDVGQADGPGPKPDGFLPICTWSTFGTVGSMDLLDVWGSHAANVFAVGKGGTVLRYAVTTWSKDPKFTAKDDMIAVSGDKTQTWVAGGKKVYRRDISGSWSSPVNDAYTITAMGGNLNGGGMLATNSKGEIWHHTSGTASWYKSAGKVSPSEPVKSIWGDSSTKEVFLAGGKYAYRVTSGKVHLYPTFIWTLPVFTGNFSAIDGVSGNVFMVSKDAVKSNGIVINKTPAGSFAPLKTTYKHDFHGVWAHSANSVWVVGDKGMYYYNGSTWKHIHTTKKAVNAVWGFGHSYVWAVGDGGEIYRCN